MIYILALLIGVVAGLRGATPLAALAIGAALGWITLDGSIFAVVAHPLALWLLIALAAVELVSDKLPRTPSRLEPTQFAVRVVAGILAGAILFAVPGNTALTAVVGAILGGVGAVAGTLGGARLRAALARSFGRDLPAALVEDILAIAAALLIVYLA